MNYGFGCSLGPGLETDPDAFEDDDDWDYDYDDYPEDDYEGEDPYAGQ